MTGDVGGVVHGHARAVQGLGHRRIQDGGRQQGLAVALAGLQLAQVAARKPFGELARKRQAVGVDPARLQEHDRVARPQALAQRQARLRRNDAGATGRQVHAAGLDDAGQRGRLAAAPAHPAGHAGAPPAFDQGLRPLRVGEPFAAARCPVGLHDQGGGPDRDQVVDGHRDRVLGDAVVEGATGQPLHLVGHEGLAAQAFDDARDQEGPDVDDVGRFAAGHRDLVEAVLREL